MTSPRPCPKHEALAQACIDRHPHLTRRARKRLRADLGHQCTPGRYGCPPYTQETR